MGDPAPPQPRLILGSTLQDLDRPFERTKLAMRETVELRTQRRSASNPLCQLFPSLLGQPKREPSPVIRILRPLDET